MQTVVAANPDDAGLQLALADLYYDGDRRPDAERTLRQLVAAQGR